MSSGSCQQISINRKRSHHRLILPIIERLLTNSKLSINQLDMIVCGIGPGSFVGLRVAVGVAKGISYATDTPLLGVSSLEALVYESKEQINQTSNKGIGVLIIMDAQLGEVYWAYYENSKDNEQMQEIAAPALDKPAEINLSTRSPIYIWGNTDQHFSSLPKNIVKNTVSCKEARPQASYLIKAAMNYPHLQPTSVEELEPMYLRTTVTRKF